MKPATPLAKKIYAVNPRAREIGELMSIVNPRREAVELATMDRPAHLQLNDTAIEVGRVWQREEKSAIAEWGCKAAVSVGVQKAKQYLEQLRDSQGSSEGLETTGEEGS